MEKFPDITPISVVKFYFVVVEDDDIGDEVEFEDLLKQMHDFAEHRFYYFCEHKKQFNRHLLAADRTGSLTFLRTENFYYRHPHYKRDYIKISESPAFDWEREVREKGPMFSRTQLALTERERRRRDTAHLTPPSSSPFVIKPSIYGIGIDIPAALKLLRTKWRKLIRGRKK